MSNSARRRFSRLISTVNTASQHQPRSSVGAGYRCGVRACQTQKSPKKRFFSGLCGRGPLTEIRNYPPLYIGDGAPAATGSRNRAAMRHFKPGNKGFLSDALVSVCHRDEEPRAKTAPGGWYPAPRSRHNPLKYNDIKRKKARGQPARLFLIRSKPLKPLIRHVMQIDGIQIGHHDSVGAVIANIGDIDPNDLVAIQTHQQR